MGSALVVQRIGHIPSKDTMLVRFQPGVPKKWKGGRVVDGTGLENQRVKAPQVRILSLPPRFRLMRAIFYT